MRRLGELRNVKRSAYATIRNEIFDILSPSNLYLSMSCKKPTVTVCLHFVAESSFTLIYTTSDMPIFENLAVYQWLIEM